MKEGLRRNNRHELNRTGVSEALPRTEDTGWGGGEQDALEEPGLGREQASCQSPPPDGTDTAEERQGLPRLYSRTGGRTRPLPGRAERQWNQDIQAEGGWGGCDPEAQRWQLRPQEEKTRLHPLRTRARGEV